MTQPQPPSNPATKDDLEKATQRYEFLLSAVVVVLVIGFLTLLFALAALIVNAWQYRPATYQDLTNQVQAQNTTIDAIAKKLDIQ